MPHSRTWVNRKGGYCSTRKCKRQKVTKNEVGNDNEEVHTCCHLKLFKSGMATGHQLSSAMLRQGEGPKADDAMGCDLRWLQLESAERVTNP